MEIKEGSVVRLKSGGPEMTVAHIETATVNGVVVKSAFCGWYVGKKPQSKTFPLHMLELVR